MGATITKARGYPIGAMARRTGVHIETIRYYERIGLMPPPDRTAGGNRQYADQDLKRLFFIRRCRELGFGVGEIRTLLEMVDRRDFTCSQVYAITSDHIETVEKKIADLKRLECTLKEMATACDRGAMPHCPIIETLFEDGRNLRPDAR